MYCVKGGIMRRFIIIACILFFVCSGCAYKEYQKENYLGIVDTDQKIRSSDSRYEIKLSYIEKDSIVAEVMKVRDDRVKVRHKEQFERCWTIKRGISKKSNSLIELPIYLAITICEIPFSILEGILGTVPKPGCEKYSKWSNWKEDTVSSASVVPYNTTVYFDCGPAGNYKLATDKDGRASLKVAPLLNRLTTNYTWNIKAKAYCDRKMVADSLTINTTRLGVTWSQPRYQADLPPNLVASVNFIDPNNNQILDATETAYLELILTNKGRGDAFQIEVYPELQGRVDGVILTPDKKIYVDTIPKGETQNIKLKLYAKEEAPSQRLRIKISIKELNGFEPLPLEINLATRPYAPPKLALTRWVIDDDSIGMSSGNGNSYLELGEQAEVTMFIQNLGQGAAEDVNIRLDNENPNIFIKELNTDLGDIPPGEWQKAVFTIRVNNRYDGPEKLPISIKVTEHRQKYGFKQILDFSLGKAVIQPEVVKIEGLPLAEENLNIKPIPPADKENQINMDDTEAGTKYAILIGINNYIDPELRPLVYAERDVKEFYKILADPKLGGYNQANIFLMIPDSERPQDRPTRENILVTLKWLSENVKPQDSLLFAFFGHGDVEKDINFIIPLNGRRAIPQDTSIRLPRLFEWLDACPAKRQIVLLDACHSGGLAKNERGLRGIKIVSKRFSEEIEKIGVVEGRAVLSSCSSDEVSYEDDKLKHGIFSYYVLKGLKEMEADRNRDFRVTVYELGNYVKNEVQNWCKCNRKSPSQTPRLVYNDTSGDIEIVTKKN